MGSEEAGTRKGAGMCAVRDLRGRSFRGESVAYCSPSGRKTKFDQILLRRHKTDRSASRYVGLWTR